jgi:hypothetical protein
MKVSYLALISKYSLGSLITFMTEAAVRVLIICAHSPARIELEMATNRADLVFTKLETKSNQQWGGMNRVS